MKAWLASDGYKRALEFYKNCISLCKRKTVIFNLFDYAMDAKKEILWYHNYVYITSDGFQAL